MGLWLPLGSVRPADCLAVCEPRNFGSLGGGACVCSFDEWHVFAVTPVICNHQKFNGVGGPPFMGLLIEASSEPAWPIALEMLAANGLDEMILVDDEYTPTPAIWHATSTYSRSGRWIFCKASC